MRRPVERWKKRKEKKEISHSAIRRGVQGYRLHDEVRGYAQGLPGAGTRGSLCESHCRISNREKCKPRTLGYSRVSPRASSLYLYAVRPVQCPSCPGQPRTSGLARSLDDVTFARPAWPPFVIAFLAHRRIRQCRNITFLDVAHLPACYFIDFCSEASGNREMVLCHDYSVWHCYIPTRLYSAWIFIA